MKEFKPIKEGKVREVYDNGDSLIIAATDRISAFDVILKNEVKDKGAILTQMSKFWFNLTENTVPNHMISTDVKDMPEFFQNEKYAGRSMMCRSLRCSQSNVSFVVTSQEVAGQATRRTEPFAVSSFQKDYRNLKNYLNQFTLLPQKLI